MTKKTMLYDLIDVSDPGIVLNEIKLILELTVERYDASTLEMVYGDIVTLLIQQDPLFAFVDIDGSKPSLHSVILKRTNGLDP